jgi:serine/threonine protein phosphatase PrpC
VAATLSIEVGVASQAKASPSEDAFLVAPDRLLFGVFDGLGSMTQSAFAARLAATAIAAAYDHRPCADCAGERAFLAAVTRGAGALIAAAVEDGMTTASVVKLCEDLDGAAHALICNIGDSRVYRKTAGTLHQCTLDDSVFAGWDLQLHLGNVVAPSGPLESAYFMLRHVMDAALGDGVALPHVWDVAVDDGDVLLAVTDGVSDNLTFSELADLLGGAAAAPRDVAQRVADAAVARSHDSGHPRSKIDDTTVVVAKVRRAEVRRGRRAHGAIG